MDRNGADLKMKAIKTAIDRHDYEDAVRIADILELKKVKDNHFLTLVAEAYEKCHHYQKAKNVLLHAYENTNIGRQLAYRLCLISVKTKEYEDAHRFFGDFVEMAPRDTGRYILKYKISKAEGASTERLIDILEEYINLDMEEKWAYELAKLYHLAGDGEKCVDMCDEISLWFAEGKYVLKALELKKKYQPLSVLQQEYYKKGKQKSQDQVLEANPNNVDFEKTRAVPTLEELRKPEEALEEQEKEKPVMEKKAEKTIGVEMTQEEQSTDRLPDFQDVPILDLGEDIRKEKGDGRGLPKELLEIDPTVQIDILSGIDVKKEHKKLMTDENKEFLTQGVVLSKEELAVFKNYLNIEGLESAIRETVRDLTDHYVFNGKSAKGNIIVSGGTKTGKTTLAIELIRLINKKRGRRDRKLAKINASALNKKGFKNSLGQLIGCDLIVEEAQLLKKTTVCEIIDATTMFTDDMLIVLEIDEQGLQELIYQENRIQTVFNHILSIREYDVKEWVAYGREYAKDKGYVMDELAGLAFYKAIDDYFCRKKSIGREEVENILEEAISKGSRKLFAKKTKEGNCIILTEKDFK